MATSVPGVPPTSANSPSAAPKSTPQDDGRLSSGAVAGIVIGVAVGVAVVTFLITFFTVRQNWASHSARLHKEPKAQPGTFGSGLRNGWIGPRRQVMQSGSHMGLDGMKDSTSYEIHLPQAADDHTLKKRTETFFDRIELHVENFYRKTAVDTVKLSEAAVRQFDAIDTGQLSAPLATLVPRSKNILPIVKHTLAHMATSAISTSAQPRWSLLPNDLVLIPRTVAMSDAPDKTRAGIQRCLSRWRVLTAYLRPDPSQDATYIAERHSKIEDMVHTFCTAFSPWKNLRYVEEQRTQSLSAILEEAADLGIFLFAQPSELRFRWPISGEAGPREVVVAPGLAKVTNEHGETLPAPLTLIRMAAQEL